MIPYATKRRQKALAASQSRPSQSRMESRSVLQDWIKTARMVRHQSTAYPISEQTALQIGAVFCAVRIRSGLMSSLPAKVYRRGDGGKDTEAAKHPVSRVLCTEPNAIHTPAIFKEQLESHLSLWGNHYAELGFDERGQVSSAMPIHPQYVTPFIDQGRPKYRVYEQGGSRVLDRSQMIHVPSLGFDGLTGASVVSLAAQSFGIAARADRMAAQFMESAAKPFLVVSHPDYLDDGRAAQLSSEIRSNYNEENTFGSMLLEGGATASFPSMPLRDAQFLESRTFQGIEIASQWFGLPPHLAGYMDNAHYNNLDEQDRALLIFTLAPLLVRTEQEWNRKAFYGPEREEYYVKFNVDALLRGQQKERYEAHRSAIQAGWKTINEVRATEDLPPLPGGDELPKPAAIWGPPAESPPARSATRDSRTQSLLEATIRSLQSAEGIQAERLAGRSDAQQRLHEWYDQHAAKAVAKIGDFGVDAVRSHLHTHRDQLSLALRDSDPKAAVELCVSGWQQHPAKLAQQLCEGDV